MAMLNPGHGSFEGFGFNSNSSSTATNEDDLGDEEKLSKRIQKISYNVAQLDKLSSSIGSSTDSKQLRKEVRDLLQETNRLTKDTGDELGEYCKNRPEDKAEYGQWKFMTERLKEELKKVVSEYQRVQEEVRKKQRTSLRQTLIQSGYHDLEISHSGEITRNGAQCQLDDLKEEEEKVNLIKERENDLKQLEQDILDINDITKAIGGMVKEQGEAIDKIEENVIIAQDNVSIAVHELSEAKENMDSSRKKKIVAAVVVIVLLSVLVLILAVTLS